MNTLSQQQELNALKQNIINNNVCPDLARNAKQLVFGEGNANADILFVGEAPGKNEDLKGLPFVGAAGKFLDQMLATINLSRKSIYITNIVKYRPPGNRDPSKQEKQAFWPYLKQQISIIKPYLLVTLGRHSLECFLPEAKISEVHGKAAATFSYSNSKQHSHNEECFVVLPLYHPAAALYNGGMRQTLIDDFARIPNILTHIKMNNHNTNLKEL